MLTPLSQPASPDQGLNNTTHFFLQESRVYQQNLIGGRVKTFLRAVLDRVNIFFVPVLPTVCSCTSWGANKLSSVTPDWHLPPPSVSMQSFPFVCFCLFRVLFLVCFCLRVCLRVCFVHFSLFIHIGLSPFVACTRICRWVRATPTVQMNSWEFYRFSKRIDGNDVFT